MLQSTSVPYLGILKVPCHSLNMVFDVSMGSCVETGAHPDFPKHTVRLQETADVALCLQPCAKIFVFFIFQCKTVPC